MFRILSLSCDGKHQRSAKPQGSNEKKTQLQSFLCNHVFLPYVPQGASKTHRQVIRNKLQTKKTLYRRGAYSKSTALCEQDLEGKSLPWVPVSHSSFC